MGLEEQMAMMQLYGPKARTAPPDPRELGKMGVMGLLGNIDLLGLAEGLSGKDITSKLASMSMGQKEPVEDLSWWQRGLGALPFIPAGGLLKGIKSVKGPKDVKVLNDAMRRAETGMNMENIRKETGWFVSPYDKKWRFEIDDSKMKLKPKESYAVKEPGYGYHFKQDLMLGDLIEHKELFEAYPEAKYIPVRHLGHGTGGAYSDTFGIQLTGFDYQGTWRRGFGENLVHEIQHAIQKLEDFARGGNANAMPYDTYRKLAGEIESREVGKRLSFTPEMRREIKPFDKRHGLIPPEEATVRFR